MHLNLYEIVRTRHPGVPLAGVQNFKKTGFRPKACRKDEVGISFFVVTHRVMGVRGKGIRKMAGSDLKASDTRARLLQAAGEVFARSGFREATVREICQLAGANVAAVNYHFGNKEGLYSSVLKYALRSALQKFPLDMGLNQNSTPLERLEAFVRSFLLRILDEGRPAWHGKLMAREVAEPTAALDQVVEEIIQPLQARLIAIVREFIPASTRDEEVHLSAMSILGQCLYYYYARHILIRLDPQKFGPKDIERLARHIIGFSLGGLKELAREASPASCLGTMTG
jgi:TetR/AcrR family transcriptional regulator, regulator of cefoperazone and chloramphenicol sensitivity